MICCAVLIGSLSACGVQSGNTESLQEMDSEPEEAAAPATKEPAEPAIILDAELKDAVACGIVTEDFFNNPDTAVTFSEFCGMLTNVIEVLEPGASEQWNQVAAAAMENGGTNIVCRNNYIHDCESKGMAVVINGSDSNWTQNTDRFNILAEGNVLERCGNSIYLWTEFLAAEQEHKYEDITFRNNYVINNAYGWRTHSDMWIDSGMGTIGDSRFSVSARDVFATGPVRIESNLFYRSAGIIINCTSSDSFAQSVVPTLAENTYVQDMGQMLFLKRSDDGQGETQCALAVDDKTMTERYLREFMKDDTGNIIIRQPADGKQD